MEELYPLQSRSERSLIITSTYIDIGDAGKFQASITPSMKYIPVPRSTHADLLCTTTTHKAISIPLPAPKMHGLSVSLPYKKTIKIIGNVDKGSTNFQKMKFAEAKVKNNLVLKAERDEYLNRLLNDRLEKEDREYKAAVAIQRHFRGFRKRPRPKYYLRPEKKIAKVVLSRLQDELCSLQQALSLKAIPGLTLEPRGKASRRRAKIEHAASMRIVRFFRMVCAKKEAKRKILEMMSYRTYKKAVAIAKFFRFIKVKTMRNRLAKVKKNESAIKIQCNVRIYLGRTKIRKLKYQRMIQKRRNEAVIKLQRIFRRKLSRQAPIQLSSKDYELIMQKKIEKLSTTVINVVDEVVLDEEICRALNDDGMDIDIEKELLLIEEKRLQIEQDMTQLIATDDAGSQNMDLCDELDEFKLQQHLHLDQVSGFLPTDHDSDNDNSKHVGEVVDLLKAQEEKMIDIKIGVAHEMSRGVVDSITSESLSRASSRPSSSSSSSRRKVVDAQEMAHEMSRGVVDSVLAKSLVSVSPQIVNYRKKLVEEVEKVAHDFSKEVIESIVLRSCS